MSYRSLALIVTALSSAHVATADAQSVYVAPGGIYVGAGPVYVTPAPPIGPQTYVAPGPVAAPAVVAPAPVYEPPAPTTYEGYVAPAPAYGPPAVSAYGAYGPPRRAYAPPAAAYGTSAGVYVAPSPYVVRSRAYVRPPVYAAEEIPPRPPAMVPQYGYGRCIVYGRQQYCN